MSKDYITAIITARKDLNSANSLAVLLNNQATVNCVTGCVNYYSYIKINRLIFLRI
jgi:hypothetical protein